MPIIADKPDTKKFFDNASVAKRTKQVAYLVEQHDKAAMFEQFIKNSEKKQIVVLMGTKRKADEVSKYLKAKNIPATAIHGNHRAVQIEEAAKAFNASEINIVITTDMILKSLNLTNIELIVNYDLPRDAQEYFVRLSYVDEIGESISFVSTNENKTFETIEFMMKQDMPKEKVKDFFPTSAPKEVVSGQHSRNKKSRHSKKKARKDTKKEL
ncbi:MAG: ATP-dependent helicase [Epsilonproteobacteria bacterium]|nr:MAG: ATP-dependent helicase [Campylobacterota bacterium]